MHLTVGWLSKSHVVRVSNVSFRQRLEYFNVVSFQAPRLVLVVGREGNHRSPSLDPRNSSASSAIGCRPERKASQPYLVDVLRLVLTHRFQLHYSVSRLFYLRRAPNHTSPSFSTVVFVERAVMCAKKISQDAILRQNVSHFARRMTVPEYQEPKTGRKIAFSLMS